MEHLFAAPRQFTAETDALLTAPGPLTKDSAYGEVVFAGSYSLNLMVNRNMLRSFLCGLARDVRED